LVGVNVIQVNIESALFKGSAIFQPFRLPVWWGSHCALWVIQRAPIFIRCLLKSGLTWTMRGLPSQCFAAMTECNLIYKLKVNRFTNKIKKDLSGVIYQRGLFE